MRVSPADNAAVAAVKKTSSVHGSGRQYLSKSRRCGECDGCTSTDCGRCVACLVKTFSQPSDIFI